MKKITLALTILLTTGILTACRRNILPAKMAAATVEHNTNYFKKDIGMAD